MTTNFSKKILIYGLNGFIGKNLAIELIKANYDVYVISSSDKIELALQDFKFFKKLKFIKINDLKTFKINYAILNSSPNNKEKNIEVFQNSIKNYKKILSNLNNDVNLVYLSSGIVCFKNNINKSNNLYRSYKKKMEDIILKHSSNNEGYYKILRIFSIFGPYMSLKKYAIGSLISSINENEIKFLNIDGKFYRDYIYVKDLIKIIKNEFNQKRSIIINISSKKYFFKKLCEDFYRYSNSKNLIYFGNKSDNLENYYLNNKIFKKEFPNFIFNPINKSLLSTLNWFKKVKYEKMKIKYEK